MSTTSDPETGPDDERQKVLEAIAADACLALFTEYGLAIRQVSPDEDPQSPEFLICSTISFSGRRLRGTLLLAMTAELPAQSSALREATIARDWVGELSNQLLGRMKIELLRHGVEIRLHLPAVLRGAHLAPLPRKAPLRPLKFILNDGVVAIWLDVEMTPGLRLNGSGPVDLGPGAGDAILFE